PLAHLDHPSPWSLMHFSSYALAACALTLLSVTAPAVAGTDPHADEAELIYGEDANALFKKALDVMEAHDLDAACPLFLRSYQLEARPGTLFTMADCEAIRGHIATAVKYFKEFVKTVTSLPPVTQSKYSSRKEKAEKRITELEPLIPHLTLTLSPDAP